MSNAILIGEIIYNTITSDSVLAVSLGTRVFPLVAPDGTTFPFVVYTRANVYPNTQTKDGWVDDRVSFQITIASEKYNESATLANRVRDLFENCKISNSSLEIYDIKLTSITELFQDNTYIQTLYFDCSAI